MIAEAVVVNAPAAVADIDTGGAYGLFGSANAFEKCWGRLAGSGVS